jgi:hypothetical protein
MLLTQSLNAKIQLRQLPIDRSDHLVERVRFLIEPAGKVRQFLDPYLPLDSSLPNINCRRERPSERGQGLKKYQFAA